jgi:hypothetical protein
VSESQEALAIIVLLHKADRVEARKNKAQALLNPADSGT